MVTICSSLAITISRYMRLSRFSEKELLGLPEKIALNRFLKNVKNMSIPENFTHFTAVVIGTVVIVLSYKSNNDFLFWIAAVITGINFLAYCVRKYYASRALELYDFYASPNWIERINVITFNLLAIMLVDRLIYLF